jgi:hypothetical protein
MMALKELSSAADWRKTWSEHTAVWRESLDQRNRLFNEHNWLRTLKLLEEYRAGNDITCDNLAQYNHVREIIDENVKVRRQAEEERASNERYQRKLLKERYSYGGNSANLSASKTPAKANPHPGTHSTPAGVKTSAGLPEVPDDPAGGSAGPAKGSGPATGPKGSTKGSKGSTTVPDDLAREFDGSATVSDGPGGDSNETATYDDGSYSPVDYGSVEYYEEGEGEGVSTSLEQTRS